MVSGAGLFLGLFNNLAMFIVLVAAYGLLTQYLTSRRRWVRQVVFGICFGVCAVASMHVKIPVAEGVIVDQRNTFVALSGGFGGPLSALICAVLTGLYRAHLGGAGVLGGVAGVCLAAFAGIGFYHMRDRVDKVWKAVLSSIVATIIILPGFLFVGDFSTGWELLKAMAVPYGSAISIGIFMVGMLLAHEEARLRAVEALRQSEQQFRALYESLVDVSYRVDAGGRFIAISPSCEKMLGYSPEELLGRRISDFYREDDRREELLEELKALERVDNHEAEIERHDGSYIWVSTNARLLRDEGGTYVGVEGVARDISPLKKAEIEKQSLEENLRQAQKMEAIGTLAGGIAHDFNNMLSPVLGYTELVRDHLPRGSDDRAHLDDVLEAATRASELTRQILTFSRKTEIEKKPVQVHLVVGEATKLLRKTIPATVEMHVELDANTGTILADPTQIHQIVLNLCTNAYHSFKGDRGRIEIRLGNRQVGSRDAGKTANLPPGRYALLTVKDTGCGMDEGTVDRIFEPFFTTKSIGEGTGMGLSVVHGIVREHQGDIVVESTVDEGSLFSVYFPLIDEPQPDDSRLPERTSYGQESILFVDDEKSLARLGQKSLERYGYQVAPFTSPRDALASFENAPDSYDLIVTDQSMPEIPGEEFVKSVKEIRPEVPIIICTGHSAFLNEEKVKAIGVHAYLMKPFRPKELAEVVRRVLDESG